MYRRIVCVVTSLASLCLGSFGVDAQSLKHQLVGSWRIVQNCEEFLDGKKNCTPFGANMKGLLMFDANSFSFQMIGGDRGKSNDPRRCASGWQKGRPVGLRCKGIFMFDTHGHFAQFITRANLPKFA